MRGGDPKKDQSYFLALMQQAQVMRARFPVGELLKPQVREIAARFGLVTADKKDSQGICFIGQVKMSDFLRHYVPDCPGKVVDVDGRVMGEHAGLHLFTIGQRKGHGIASPREGVAYVVVGKNPERNELVIGYEGASTPGLYARECVVRELSFVNETIADGSRVLAQPRYRAAAEPVRFVGLEDGRAKLRFERPQRALTPGQICAFYDGGRLLGGAVFEQVAGLDSSRECFT